MKKLLLALGLIFLPSSAYAGCATTLPFVLQPNTLADANQVMANFNALNTALANTCAQSGINSDITALTNAISILGLPGLSAVVVANGTVAHFSGSGLQLTPTLSPWIITGTFTSSSTDLGNATAGEGILSVVKYTNYSVPGLQGGVASSIFAANEVRDGVWGNVTGTYSIVYNFNTQHSQPGSTASAVGMNGITVCEVTSCSASWGGLAAFYDTTGQTNPIKPSFGFEIDSYSHGTDTNSMRVGLLIVSGTPDGIGSSTLGTGLSFGAGPGIGSYNNVINIQPNVSSINGISMNGATFSGLQLNLNGWNVDGHGAMLVSPNIAGPNAITIGALGGGNMLLVAPNSAFTNGLNLLNTGATFSGNQINAIGMAVNNAGDLLAHTVQPSTYTVLTLPPCSVNGRLATISDSAAVPTYNAAIGGGGGVIFALVMCQGGSWAFH